MECNKSSVKRDGRPTRKAADIANHNILQCVKKTLYKEKNDFCGSHIAECESIDELSEYDDSLNDSNYEPDEIVSRKTLQNWDGESQSIGGIQKSKKVRILVPQTPPREELAIDSYFCENSLPNTPSCNGCIIQDSFDENDVSPIVSKDTEQVEHLKNRGATAKIFIPIVETPRSSECSFDIFGNLASGINAEMSAQG